MLNSVSTKLSELAAEESLLLKAQAPTPSREICSEAALSAKVLADDSLLMQNARRIASEIEKLPTTFETAPRALVVGGYVRDSALQARSKDIDLEVYGVSAPQLVQLLTKLYPKQINLVGEAFGVIKISLGDGQDIDISMPRRESSSGPGHRDFTIIGNPALSIEEAARRRDFTMNALAADPLTGEILDCFNGLESLNSSILCVTDPERFVDDPLRVYRAVQFAARLSMQIDPRSELLLKTMVEQGALDHLPKERVSEELKKLLLKSKSPSIGFELMRELGITERYFPELHALIGIPQEPEWHPEGDVWIHTMMCVDQAARLIRLPTRSFSEEEQLQIMVGTLTHDFGKPATTEFSEGRIRSINHEAAGVEPTRLFLDRLVLGNSVRMAAEHCAAYHLSPGVLHRQFEKNQIDERGYRSAVGRIIRKIAPVSPEVFLTVSEADSRGRAIPDIDWKPYPPGISFREIMLNNNFDKVATQPLIQGRDLIALGLQPGKQIGAIIKDINAARDRGEIETRDEAMKYATKLISDTAS